MFDNFDVNSTKKFNEKYSDVIPLSEFIEDCECQGFIDEDGFAREILLNGNIIFDEQFDPSDVLLHKDQLLQKQAELGELYVVWYNK